MQPRVPEGFPSFISPTFSPVIEQIVISPRKRVQYVTNHFIGWGETEKQLHLCPHVQLCPRITS